MIVVRCHTFCKIKYDVRKQLEIKFRLPPLWRHSNPILQSLHSQQKADPLCERTKIGCGNDLFQEEQSRYNVFPSLVPIVHAVARKNRNEKPGSPTPFFRCQISNENHKHKVHSYKRKLDLFLSVIFLQESSIPYQCLQQDISNRKYQIVITYLPLSFSHLLLLQFALSQGLSLLLPLLLQLLLFLKSLFFLLLLFC